VFAVTFLHHQDSSWVTSLRTIGCFSGWIFRGRFLVLYDILAKTLNPVFVLGNISGFSSDIASGNPLSGSASEWADNQNFSRASRTNLKLSPSFIGWQKDVCFD
jgi:hypothetical protein